VGACAPWRKVSSVNATGRARPISATCSRGSGRVKAKSSGPRGPPCRTPLWDLTTSLESWTSKQLCWPYANATMGSRAGQRCATAANMQSQRTLLNAFCQSTCQWCSGSAAIPAKGRGRRSGCHPKCPLRALAVPGCGQSWDRRPGCTGPQTGTTLLRWRSGARRGRWAWLAEGGGHPGGEGGRVGRREPRPARSGAPLLVRPRCWWWRPERAHRSIRWGLPPTPGSGP
jgi:hypothetical protein